MAKLEHLDNWGRDKARSRYSCGGPVKKADGGAVDMMGDAKARLAQSLTTRNIEREALPIRERDMADATEDAVARNDYKQTPSGLTYKPFTPKRGD